MPLKDPKKRKEYHAKYMREVWYPNNRKKHIGYVRHLKIKVAEFIDCEKRKGVCVDCGFSGKKHPYVLDFDHLSHKKFNVGSWQKYTLSIESVKQEMKKCELVCANCHRIRTFTRSS